HGARRGAALPRVPEPDACRLARRARDRPQEPHPRTAARGKVGAGGARLHGAALRRLRAVPAAAAGIHRAAMGRAFHPARRRRGGIDCLAAKKKDAGNRSRGDPMNRKRYLIVAAALAFPLAVAGIYLGVGTPAALSPQKAAAKDGANPHAISSEQLNAMVGRLAERMRTTPEDTDGWIMLARSYAALGRYSESSAAYEQA